MMETYETNINLLQEKNIQNKRTQRRNIEFDDVYISRVHAVGQGKEIITLGDTEHDIELNLFELDFRFFNINCEGKVFPLIFRIENQQQDSDDKLEFFVGTKPYPNWSSYDHYYSFFSDPIQIFYS